MKQLSASARGAAILLASVLIGALGLRFIVSLEASGTVPAALWLMLRFFTIIGNALAAIILLAAGLGMRRAATPFMLGGITLLMALIGIVYGAVLRQQIALSGMAHLANILLHYVTPPLVALFWLCCAPKGGLTRSAPLLWALLPLSYFAYALVRAGRDEHYPYPFMDVSKLGWTDVITNAAIIASGFVLAGLLLVWLDQAMGRRARRRRAPVLN